MDFNSNSGKGIYADRTVSDWWLKWADATIDPKSKIIADIGCGGGIYSQGFFQLGASAVIMVDSSEKYVEEARINLSQYNPTILLNDCTKLDIDDSTVDIVFERAVIHHLSIDQMLANLKEIKRILKPDGHAYIQDRTYQDVTNRDDRFWIRNTLFECFPRLLTHEKTRRPDSEKFQDLVKQAGLEVHQVEKIPEVRKDYATIDDLCGEIRERKGKSILFELSDEELDEYCQGLKKKAVSRPMVEQDIWTVWNLRNPCQVT